MNIPLGRNHHPCVQKTTSDILNHYQSRIGIRMHSGRNLRQPDIVINYAGQESYFIIRLLAVKIPVCV